MRASHPTGVCSLAVRGRWFIIDFILIDCLIWLNDWSWIYDTDKRNLICPCRRLCVCVCVCHLIFSPFSIMVWHVMWWKMLLAHAVILYLPISLSFSIKHFLSSFFFPFSLSHYPFLHPFPTLFFFYSSSFLLPPLPFIYVEPGESYYSVPETHTGRWAYRLHHLCCWPRSPCCSI